jgi:hypothetical protein
VGVKTASVGGNAARVRSDDYRRAKQPTFLGVATVAHETDERTSLVLRCAAQLRGGVVHCSPDSLWVPNRKAGTVLAFRPASRTVRARSRDSSEGRFSLAKCPGGERRDAHRH